MHTRISVVLVAVVVVSALAAAASGEPAAALSTAEEAVSPLRTPEAIDRARQIRAAIADGDIDWLEELAPTPAEREDAERRERIKKQATPTSISEAIGSHYGGMYRDSETGDVVALTTGDVEAARDALSFVEGNPRVVAAEFTLADLTRFYEVLVDRLPDSASVGLYVKRNRIGIGIDEPARFDVSGVPPSAIFYQPYDGPAVAAATDQADYHSYGNLIPGVVIELAPEGEAREGRMCTWGFTAYDTTAADRAFVLTAGHCSPDGWTNLDTVQVDLYQTSTNDDVPCTDCTSTQRGDDRGMYLRRTNHTDLGRIRSTGLGDANCTHTLSHNCAATITSVQDKSDDAVGDDVCVSLPVQDQSGGGHEDVYVCGELQDPVSQSITYTSEYGNHTITNAREVDIVSGTGNSGAGFKWGSNLYGMLFATYVGQDRTFFQTAEDIDDKLGSNVDICTFDGCK